VLRLAPLLADQSQKPDRVIFVVTSQQDVSADTLAYFHDVCPAEIVIAPKGLTKQRNAGLQKIAQSDQQAPAYVLMMIFCPLVTRLRELLSLLTRTQL
jgi:hypothetical protein